MLRTTSIKNIAIIFAYSIVLFHSFLPHCHDHGNGSHRFADNHAEHQAHDGDCGDEHDHKQLGQDDGLHSGYFKTAFNLVFPELEIIAIPGKTTTLQALSLVQDSILFLSEEPPGGITDSYDLSLILRGPPAC